jgi:hypothetical protein
MKMMETREKEKQELERGSKRSKIKSCDTPNHFKLGRRGEERNCQCIGISAAL